MWLRFRVVVHLDVGEYNCIYQHHKLEGCDQVLIQVAISTPQQKGELHTSDCGDDKSTQKFQPHFINSKVCWTYRPLPYLRLPGHLFPTPPVYLVSIYSLCFFIQSITSCLVCLLSTGYGPRPDAIDEFSR